MSANKLRASFLEDADEVLGEIKSRMLGRKSKYPAADGVFLSKYFDALLPIVHAASDPVAVAWKDKDTSERVDEVLLQVASGDFTPEEGKRLISLISMGMEPVEMAELAAKIEELEK